MGGKDGLTGFRADLAGKLVYHGRQWTLKLAPAHHAVLSEALSHVRRFALAP